MFLITKEEMKEYFLQHLLELKRIKKHTEKCFMMITDIYFLTHAFYKVVF